MNDVNAKAPDATKQLVTQALPIENMDNLNDAEFEKLYKSTMDFDTSTPEVDKEIEQKKQADTQVKATALKELIQEDVETPKRSEPLDEKFAKAAMPLLPESLRKAYVYGARATVRNTYNALVGIADYLDEAITGDSDINSLKVSKDSKDTSIMGVTVGLGEGSRVSPGEVEKIAQAVTEVGIPLVASMGLGSAVAVAKGVGMAKGLAAGVTIDSTINALVADDQTASTISNMLQNTWVGEAPAAAAAIDYLAIKPEDSEITKRVKIFAETMGLGGALGGAIWGLSRTPVLINKIKEGFKSKKALEEGAILNKVDDVLPESAVAKSDEAVSSLESGTLEIDGTVTKGNKKFADEFDAQWAARTDEVLSTPSELDTVVNQASRHFDQMTPEDFAYISRGDDETVRAGRALADNPEEMSKILSMTPEDGVLNAQQKIAVQIHSLRKADDFYTSAGSFLEPGAPIDEVVFMRNLENTSKLDAMATGHSSGSGASLRAEQLLAEGAGLTVSQVVKQLAAEGKQKLVNDLVKQYGGLEKIRNTKNKVAFIAKVKEIGEMPPEAFQNMRKQMNNMPAQWSGQQKITQLAYNTMLSPISTGLAIVGNATTTATAVAVSYARALTPGAKLTMEAANAHAAAVWGAMWDMATISKAKAAMDNPVLNSKFIRSDLDYFLPGAKLDATPGQATRRELGTLMGKIGFTYDFTKTIGKSTINPLTGMSTHLAGVDTYWNIVNQRGFLMREAATTFGDIADPAAKAAAMRNFVNDPPAKVATASYEAARFNTLTADLTGKWKTTHETASFVAGLPFLGETYGFGKIVQPFMKSTLNAIQMGLEYSPAARFYPKTAEALKAGGMIAEEAKAKMYFGSTIMGAFAAANYAGVVKINGPWHMNRETNKALPYDNDISITFGETTFNLRNIEPLRTIMGMSYMFSKMAGHLEDAQYEEVAATGLATLVEISTPESMLDTMKLFTDLKDGDPAAGKKFLIAEASKFIPYGGTLRFVRNQVDGTTRDTRTFENFFDLMSARFQNTVPFLSKNLAPTRDMFGNKVEIPDGYGPNGMSPVIAIDGKTKQIKMNYEKIMAHAEVIKEIDNGLGQYTPDKPSNKVSIEGERVTLDADQYSKYLLARSGKDPDTGKMVDGDPTYQEMVEGIFKKYKFNDKDPKDIPEMDYYDMIVELTEADNIADRRGKEWLYMEPSVMDSILEKDEKRMANEMRMMGSGVTSGR